MPDLSAEADRQAAVSIREREYMYVAERERQRIAWARRNVAMEAKAEKDRQAAVREQHRERQRIAAAVKAAEERERVVAANIAAAKAAQLHDFILGLDEGYETWIGERGVTLSGGQRQRLAIARTLIMNPQILILDDSLSSVDTETEHLIQRALKRLMVGRTSFVIAQRLAGLVDADQIVVLNGGSITERGTHDVLLAAGGLYKDIYDLQALHDNDAIGGGEFTGSEGLLEEKR